MNRELKYIAKGVLYAAMLLAIIAVIYFIFYPEKKKPRPAQPVSIGYEDLMQTEIVASGKALFTENCSSCHSINNRHELFFDKIANNDYDRKVLYAFIRNSDSVIQSGNRYYVELFNAFNKTKMKSFPNLTDNEIDAIIAYIKVQQTFRSLGKH